MTSRARQTIGIACVAALLAVMPATAGISPQPFRTGLFGVTAGQTVRVSVFNAGEEKGIINPCCKVWDMSGNLLYERDGESLLKGVGMSCDFGLPQGPVQGGRSQVRVEVELESAVKVKVRPDDFLMTLEVFDNATGRTAFTMPFFPPDPVRASIQ